MGDTTSYAYIQREPTLLIGVNGVGGKQYVRRHHTLVSKKERLTRICFYLPTFDFVDTFLLMFSANAIIMTYCNIFRVLKNANIETYG